MDLPHVRSLLFAPGSDGRKLAKALSSGADAVVCDLEDAVAPPDKEAARNVVADALASGVDALVLPKSSPEAVATLGPEGPPVVAIVETAMGLRQAFEIGSQAR